VFGFSFWHEVVERNGGSDTNCYVHNFWIKEENRIGAKPGIKRKYMDLIEEILTSNGFN
jgi:hypothetical protein